MQDGAAYPPVSPVSTGLRGRCPRCGDGPMFDGYLKIAPACSNCDLDFDFVDSADGPAVFVIMIVGFIVCGLALWVEVAIRPAIWVHMIIWIPLVAILSMAMLRPLKGLLIALQFFHNAAPGQLSDD